MKAIITTCLAVALAAPALAACPTSGMVHTGNIDLAHRQVIHNANGTISTVRSASYSIDGREVLLPTAFDGRLHSDKETIERYKQTGEHLGTFKTVKDATSYAKCLHNEQEKQYKN